MESTTNDSPDELGTIPLGIIGGSGIYRIRGLEDVQELDLSTPFGKPGSTITTGNLHGRSVAFIARHGRNHSLTPDNINYRANIFALKSLGVQAVIGISACGSLRQDFAPGDLVIPNQLVDNTRNRASSFFDQDLIAHISVDQPFCPNLSGRLFDAAQSAETSVHMHGTAITISGPRFSTKAESDLYRSWAIDIIGMTTAPEAFLAREAELCYASLVHITDYDVWLSGEKPVTVNHIQKSLQQNAVKINQTIENFILQNNPPTPCKCGEALKAALASPIGHVSPETKEKLSFLIEKYLPKT